MTVPWFRLILLLWLGSAVSLAAGESEAGGVVIVANSADSDSMALAHYYAQRRSIPEGNIIGLPMSEADTITWPEFVSTIFNPLRQKLVADGWIVGAATGKADAMGRLRYDIVGHRIRYLVTCRGVPVRIAADPALLPGDSGAVRRELRTNRAAVDAELALLARDQSPTPAMVRNPLFEKENPEAPELAAVVRVARLDGPTLGDAKALVDSALAAERDGLRGRAYVDLLGPHRTGDDWLRETAKELETAGFDTEVENTRQRFGLTDRMDAPAFYFGWYTANVEGPFLTPGFRFASGAVALHIHSSSASALRSADRSWAGPLIHRGAAAVFGNVYEPYLELTIEPQLLVRSLIGGHTLGEAIYFATPYLSWQCLAVGDPLYRPFAVGLDAQWNAQARRKGDPLDQYVVLRKANLLRAAGNKAQAAQVLVAGFRDHPGSATALALAEQQETAGDKRRATKTLRWFLRADALGGNQAGAALSAADALEKLGDNPDALTIEQRLIGCNGLGKSWHVALLTKAIPLAEREGRHDLTAKWNDERAALLPPAKPEPAPAQPKARSAH